MQKAAACVHAEHHKRCNNGSAAYRRSAAVSSFFPLLESVARTYHVLQPCSRNNSTTVQKKWAFTTIFTTGVSEWVYLFQRIICQLRGLVGVHRLGYCVAVLVLRGTLQ